MSDKRFLIRGAEDGGFFIRANFVSRPDSDRGPIVYAGSLDKCLSYLRKELKPKPEAPADDAAPAT